MERVRIRFASENGPSLNELRSIRSLIPRATKWRTADMLAAWRGVSALVLPLEDVTLEVLREAGLVVEDEPRAALDTQLGLPAVREGELRWSFWSAFEQTLVLGARCDRDVWQLDLRRLREDIEASHQRLVPETPAVAVPHAPEIEVWASSAPDDAAIRTALETWRSTPPSGSGRVFADGYAVYIRWRDRDGEHTDSSLSCPYENGDRRGVALLCAALELARRTGAPAAVFSPFSMR